MSDTERLILELYRGALEDMIAREAEPMAADAVWFRTYVTRRAQEALRTGHALKGE
jgi:hypothetical protein